MGWFSEWKQKRKKAALEKLVSKGQFEEAKTLAGTNIELREHLGHSFLDAGHLDESRKMLGSTSFKSFVSELLEHDGVGSVSTSASFENPKSVEEIVRAARLLRDDGEEVKAVSFLESNAHRTHEASIVLEALAGLHRMEAWKRLWDLADVTFGDLKNAVDINAVNEVRRYRELALSHLEGAETAQLSDMLSGQFDASAGGSYLVVARALMKKSPVLNPNFRLLSASAELAEADARLRLDRNDVSGLLRKGSAHLRHGDVSDALAAFSKANNLSPKNFAAVAGVGACKLAQESRSFERISRLPDIAQIELIEKVFPDWNQLTNIERRLVTAAVMPLKQFLPKLAASDRTLRFVPLDVRVTDLPDFSHLKKVLHQRDQRSWDAIGGLAGDGLACVKVEEMVRVDDLGFTVAHEFAHLVHEVVGEQNEAMILKAWRKACKNEFAFDQYQLSNHHEFFAVSYSLWLGRKYHFPQTLESDAEGHLESALGMFEQFTESKAPKPFLN
jgi:tetratricopeptide (TPR) repeat protein